MVAKIRTPRSTNLTSWRRYIRAGGLNQMFKQKTAAVVTKFGLLVASRSGQFRWATRGEQTVAARWAKKAARTTK